MNEQRPEIKETVTYYRVSDKKQGDGKECGTGHGLDAQMRDVEFLRQRLGAAEIDSRTEIESGGNDDRPKLAEAVAICKKTGATLIVAKLDRLARSTYLIACLQKAGIKFICADNPTANELTIHILAAVAENELKMIRARTKAGLESAKLKGKKLGSTRPGHWDGKENKRGVFSTGMKEYLKAKSEKARSYYAYLLPRITLMRENGDTIQQIVEWLNTNGHKTSTGRAWSTSVLYEIMSRYLRDENLLVEEVA
jgi:DNA invertase Pin-like site-specific DNA recombinase